MTAPSSSAQRSAMQPPGPADRSVVTYSRRTFVLAGGLAFGAATAGDSSPTASAAGFGDDPSSRTQQITQVGAPALLASLVPQTSGSTAQQIELTRTDEFFMTQSRPGTAAGRFTTVISRNQGTAGPGVSSDELDAMVVVDGGHGMGLHVQTGSGGRRTVWASLQGANQQGDAAGGRLARFLYTPGTFTIDTVPGGVWFARQFTNASGDQQEAIYNFDWAKGYAVERMFDFGTGHQERFTRRRITDILQGADRPFGTLTLPVNTPTLQGFTTMNDSLFRWCGMGNSGSGSPVAGDPMAIEQYDWGTGALIARRSFPTLGQSGGAWRDGSYEPEGCSVHREADGTASLLIGVTTGRSGNHDWLVYAFPGIGDA